MNIKEIKFRDLYDMKNEYLVFQGCGGDLQEWYDGIAKLMIDEGCAKKGYKPNDRVTLKNLLERMIEVRGDEGDFNDIDTSEIESMEMLFYYNNTFNGDISGWDFSIRILQFLLHL
mgnify:CR=1 FL=1